MPGEGLTIDAVKRTKRAVAGALGGALFSLFLAAPAIRPGPPQSAQEPAPPQKVRQPNYDYMSSFMSNRTNPLGLKEDPVARRMLGQGSVPWAIRAGSRHILD
jgi:hypothetical protein